MPATATTVLVLSAAAGTANRLNLEARRCIDELMRLPRPRSARTDSAIDLLDRAAGLLADARGELAQAATVAAATTKE